MSRESISEKALQLIARRALTVDYVQGSRIAARCRGSGGHSYWLEHRDGMWRCSCLAVGECCHLAALKLVTDPEPIFDAPD